MKKNPFNITYYTSPEEFCNRENEKQFLISAVYNNRNITLISPRRMGKTGLIDHVFHHIENEKKFQTIYFDLLPTNNVNEFINNFCSAAINQIETKTEKIIREISGLFSRLRPTISFDVETGNPEIRINTMDSTEENFSINTIFNYLNSQKKPIVIALDEFQQINYYPEKKIEALLRSNIQKSPNLQFIFSGSHKHMMISMFSDSDRPFYKCSELFNLNKIRYDDYYDFIIYQFSNAGRKIDRESIKHVLDFTNSFTYYVQYLCNRIYEGESEKITITIVKNVINNILKQNEFYYQEYRRLLTKYQYSVLKAIAKEHEVDKPFSGEFIGKHKLGSPSSVKSAIDSLIDKELILLENDLHMVYDVFHSRYLERN